MIELVEQLVLAFLAPLDAQDEAEARLESILAVGVLKHSFCYFFHFLVRQVKSINAKE